MVASHKIRTTFRFQSFFLLPMKFLMLTKLYNRILLETKKFTHRRRFYFAYARFLGDWSYFTNVSQRVQELFWRWLEDRSLGRWSECKIVRFHGGRRVPHANFDISFVTFSHFRDTMQFPQNATINNT